MTKNNLLRFATFFVFSIVVACGGTSEREKIETLGDAIEEYAYALRWGRSEDAVSYHVNEDGSKPEIDSSIMDSVRVTGFEIKERIINPEQTKATVKGVLNYYSNNSASLRTLKYDQHWWYESKSGQWFLDSEFPKF
jgi:hypothetical protein